MVLIRMIAWLQELRKGIKDRRDASKPLSALDERLDQLAGLTLGYLTSDPSSQTAATLPVTRIANGVGNGISQFAFVGSLGPDIPAAGYILALNQEWASRQLHRGGPRRAYEQVKSTTFVLKLLELAEKFEREPRTTGLRRRDTIAYALGHLSHIAADVLLHPAVHELADQGQLDPLTHRKFEIALDARVAHGFFQREDLHEGESWEDYYLNLDEHREPLTRLMGDLSEAFKETYGGVMPNAAVCALPDRSKCLAPKFETDFLVNGYRNTTKWALDAGYDHGPQGLNVLWTLAIVGTAVLSVLWLGIGTTRAWTWTNLIAGANAKAIEDANRENKDDWEKHGVQFAHAWRDIVEEALNWSGRALLPFAFILGGDFWMYPLTVWQAPDGVFGQGTEDPGVVEFVFPIIDVALFVFEEADVEHTQTHLYKWIAAGVGLGLEVLEHVLKLESRKDNQESDLLGHALLYPRLVILVSHFVGNASSMLWKHSRKQGVTHPSGIHGEDFVVPILCSALTSGILVWATNWFTDHVLEHTARAPWPSADSSAVDSRLRVEVIGNRRMLFPPTDRGLDFKVRLFPTATADPGGAHFPEDKTIAANEFDQHEEKDRAARREALKPWDDEKYTLPELFEHAAQFAGLLGMAAVAYNDAAPPVRQHMTAIFKDWNLDFASVEQWKALMEVKSDGTLVGVLRAAQSYTLDLAAGVDTLNTQATEILRQALGVTDVAGSVDADFIRSGASLATLDVVRARGARLTRPGAVLLANVDIEKVPAIAAPLPSRVGLLDAQVDAKISVDGNDKDELTRFRIRKPGVAGSPHDLVLRLNAADATRVRIFEVTAGAPDTWLPRLGATSAGVVEEYTLPAGDPAEVEFAIEAKWLTGDLSVRPAPGPGPISPLPFAPGGVANGAPTVAERRPNEVWLEILHKEGGAIVPGIRDTALFTIAPFLLTPNTQRAERIWITYIPDSLTRLRVTPIPAGAFAPTDTRAPGNHPTVADVHDVLASDPLLAPLLNVTTHPAASGSLAEFDAHNPVPLGDATNAKLFYIIGGANVADEVDTISDVTGFPGVKMRVRQTSPDQWVQDAFELGYTFAPHARMHVALQNPRTPLSTGLGKFVDRELPAENLGLFASLPVKTDATDYGGNIECSMPVTVTTAAIADGPAGPEVPEQRPATHGKILLGEGTPHLFNVADSFASQLNAGTVTAPLVAEFKAHNVFLNEAASVKTLTPDRRWRLTIAPTQQYELRRAGGHVAVHLYRGVMDDYRTFLVQQRVQPIVNIDTSWLQVGHVDEVMAIVPDTDPAIRARLLVANSQLAVDLLREALTLHDSGPAAHPLTKMFRRRRWDGAPAPESIAQAINAAQTVRKVWERGRVFNEKIDTLRLRPIRERLVAALGLAAGDVIQVPVLYDSLPDPLMSHLGAVHWRPSAPPATTEKFTVVRTAAFIPNQANVQVVNDHILVPRPFGPRMKPADIVTVLTNAGVAGVALGDLAGLDEHDSWERRGTTLTSIAGDYGVAAAAIKSHPANAGKFTGADTVKNNWDRIRIPEGRVDLFEACTRARLKPTGAKVHFIHTWEWYHIQSGDIHCGTNVQRTPMEDDAAFAKWWDAEAMRG
jgi:hypothetical protein